MRDATFDAIHAGVRWVQLRDHAADEDVFLYTSASFVAALQEVAPDIVISINTRTAVARRLRMGLHVGGRGPSVAEARRAVDGVLSAAVHTLAEATHAEVEGADAVLFSPIFPTASKPGHVGLGIDALAACCSAVSVPVLALGGVVPDHVAACLDAGAHGVVVLSGILHAPNPARAASRYIETLTSA